VIEVIATKVHITHANSPNEWSLYFLQAVTELTAKANGRVLWDTLQITTEVDVTELSTYMGYAEKREKSLICRVEVETAE